jgi:excisionase family DNA binding protein
MTRKSETIKKLYTISEISRSCKISERTVRREIASGALKAVYLGPGGRLVRVTDSAYQRYLAAREQ